MFKQIILSSYSEKVNAIYYSFSYNSQVLYINLSIMYHEFYNIRTFSKHCNTNRLCLILLRIHLSFQKSFPQYLADSSCCVCSQSVKLLSNYMETLCEISSSCCGFIEESTTILSVNVYIRTYENCYRFIKSCRFISIHSN